MENTNSPVPIEEIPTAELLADRSASLTDIEYCRYALLHDITRYGGPNHDEYSVEDRLKANEQMVEVIEAELKTRNFVFITLPKDRQDDKPGSVAFDPGVL